MKISIWLKGLKKLFLASDCKNIQKMQPMLMLTFHYVLLYDYNRLIEQISYYIYSIPDHNISYYNDTNEP